MNERSTTEASDPSQPAREAARPRIVLASASPIRAALLRSAGLRFETAPARIDETALIDALRRAEAGPERIAVALAEAKARVKAAESVVAIGADQLLIHDGVVYEAAPDPSVARARLRRFAGSSHDLLTGFAVLDGDRIVASGARRVMVRMRALSEGELDRYCEAAGPALTQTVGGYEIEGSGARIIEAIEGDYFAALGLALFDVLAALRRCGATDW